MVRSNRKMLLLGAGALVLVAGWATSAIAQAQATPKSWNYEIRDGKRVPKGNRVTNADGSWRDSVIFSVLADEWPAVKAGLQRRLA